MNTDWVPYRYDHSGDRVYWTRLGSVDFTEPFFQDTIRVCLRTKANQRTTTFAELLQTNTENVLPFAMQVFHVSRCGSTLLAQMLAQSPQNVVLSEPGILDDILVSGLSDTQKVLGIQRTLALLGQQRRPVQRQVFVKWDSWHLHFISLIRRTFAGVPMVFLYRNPEEVLASHQKMRGSHMVPGLLPVNFVQEEIPAYDLQLYAVKVLQTYFREMLKWHDSAFRLVNYYEMPEVVHRLVRVLGIRFDESEQVKMNERTMYHSKGPTGRAVSEVAQATTQLADEDLMQLYQQLERFRLVKT